jgi:hypothetical protein
MKLRAGAALSAVVALSSFGLLVAGCGGGSHGGGVSSAGNGTLNLQVTDAPFPYTAITSAKVTLTDVSLEGSGSQGFATVFSGSQTLDLITLQNGITTRLTTVQVPAGPYAQMRLVISGGSITLADGRTFDLTAPSSATAGLKVFFSPPLTVTSGVSQDLLLDIDLSRSFEAVPNGATQAASITGFLFHPVVRVSNLSTVGRITGKVLSTNRTVATADDTAIAGATVTVRQAGVTLGTAQSAADGSYTLLGLAPGLYDVEAEATGFQTGSSTAQTVAAGSFTTVDVRLTPN